MKWNEIESEHHVFCVHPNSLAEKEIDHIIEIQEYCCHYVMNVLKVEMEEKIYYYLCESEEEVGFYKGDFLPSHSFSTLPNVVYVVYNRKQKRIGFYEETHLIADYISYQKNVALKEGLAMFFEKKWFDISNFEWVIYLLESDDYVSIQKLLKGKVIDDCPAYLVYPVMGAFTQYLILTYGVEKYLKLYCMQEQTLNKCFKDVYDCSMKMMETEFLNYIRLFRLDHVVRERIIEQLD